MMAPANNPFGAPPAQVNNPFASPAPSNQGSSVFGAPAQSTFGAPSSNNPFGASSAKPSGAPAANPFGAPIKNPFGASAQNAQNKPFGAPTAGNGSSLAAANPFGAASGQTSAFGSTPAGSAPQSKGSSRQPSPAGRQNQSGRQQANLVGAPQGPSGKKRTPSPFDTRQRTQAPSKRAQASEESDSDAMSGRKSKGKGFGGLKSQPPAANKATNNANTTGFAGRTNRNSQEATPFADLKSTLKKIAGQETEKFTKKAKPGEKNKKPERQVRFQPTSQVNGNKNGPMREPTERTKELSTFAYEYANDLLGHLKKENINPPQWPAEPGNPNKRGAIESLKEAYKKYRARVYASLRKADKIDDPEKRRKLEDALPFKGICEDMCPEFEQVSRIAEYDVMTEEKSVGPDGHTLWPDPAKMVKKFGRSAAGQDAPLPMDVRTVDALRRTTDYLFNDLLQSENNLPAMHNFLWDRTRAVRKDFTFHSQKTAEEMKDMVYCFEAIARFHAIALHLLSRKGFANEDFDQKQEIEQLGRTILSLMEAYDVCRDMKVPCENEPEFRAYYLLLNAGDPAIAKRIPTWGKEYWFESEEVQTALSLIHTMEDVREPKGPIKPRKGTTLSDTSFTNYFAIVEDPRVSYTMACIAEIHFTTVRQGILRNLVRCYARHRDAPRTITASDLNAMLRFDTPEEAVEFAELHEFEFTTWVPDGKPEVKEPYLLLNQKKKIVPSPRVRQSFSAQIVERKRQGQPLPFVIYNTVYEEMSEKPAGSIDDDGSPDSLFVSQKSPELTRSVFGAPSTTTPSFFNAPSAASTTAAPSTGTVASSIFSFPTTSSTPQLRATSSTGTTSQLSAFGSAQSSQPASSTTTTSVFGGFGKPAEPATTESPFSSLSQPTTTTMTTTPAAAPKPNFPAEPPKQPEQAATSSTTTSPKTADKNPFSFLKNNDVLAKQPSTSFVFPSTSTLSGSAATPTPSISTTTTFDATTKPTASTQTYQFGAAPAGGSSLFPTATPTKSADKQPVTSASIPSITVTPPPTSTPATSAESKPTLPAALPAIFGQQPLPPASTSQPSLFASIKPAASPTKPQEPPPPPKPKRDLMADFTKWFVTGDGGIMEEFTEETLRHLLWDVWQRHQREEAERKRKAEEEESWRLAREHLTHRLQVKYFYRWREKARALATKRLLREGKEKMRLYREQQRLLQKQRLEEQRKAEEEARRKAKREIMEDAQHFSFLASQIRARRASSMAYSADQTEEQLVASGIFSGLNEDPHAIARSVVREARAAEMNGSYAVTDAASVTPSRSTFRYPESDLELEPAPSHHGSDTASSIGGRREGWKTRSLREKLGIGVPKFDGRRSLSGTFSADGLNSFRQSLRSSVGSSVNGRATNFSVAAAARKRNSEELSGDEIDTMSLGGAARKRRALFGSSVASISSAIGSLSKSRHWELRARGFVPMPDGAWLPEAVAKLRREQAERQRKEEDERKRREEQLRQLQEQQQDDDEPEFPFQREESPTKLSTGELRARLAKLKEYKEQRSKGLRNSIDLGTHSPLHPTDPFQQQEVTLHQKRKRDANTAAFDEERASRCSPSDKEADAKARGYSPISTSRKRLNLNDTPTRSWSHHHNSSSTTPTFVRPPLPPQYQQHQPESSPPPPLAVRPFTTVEAAAAARAASPSTTPTGVPTVSVLGREETAAMVEDTWRMLRELHECMDQLEEKDREERPVMGMKG
ncbi:putative SAC3 family protein [Thermochaetoides thermophila DSM 1495]|uniref:Putative SAC3 family protein n=1 Tax=Chaetomium thermophilum (strain DSM 1495 / CBS 144.50 / IMI 039719) TaxID=759272 RepID=G0SGL4_CHATD|nr:putative SAC3 family protein [Thermochaetoides thermophila DSM 1495]EGS17353.1 putative SAC3 family protein [Thermochaetoides thermophila DSM 1495]